MDEQTEPCVGDDAVAGFVAGTLNPAARAVVEDHLDRCEVCRRTVSVMVAISSSDAWSADLGPSSAEQDPDRPSLPAGTRVGRYIVMHVLGRGGMGVVYEAYDPELDRKVALKLLRSASSGPTRERAVVALRREASRMARLSHPNVVTVYDAGTDGDEVYIAMELMTRGTLRAFAAQLPNRRQLLDICIEAGRGLAAAHDEGLVHRDFKPDNVLVGADGHPRVSDFGLARFAASGVVTSGGGGTAHYMSPEQRRGEDTGAATDQFSFCVCVAELLSGADVGHELDGASKTRLTGQLPPKLRSVLRRGMAADAEDRYPSMPAVLQALAAATRPRRPLVLAGIAFAAVLVAVGVFGFGRSTPEAAAAQTDLATPAWPWNPVTSLTLLQRFASVDPNNGVRTWIVVRRALDDYTRQWRAASTELDGQPSAYPQAAVLMRSQCLRRRRDAMDVLLGFLAEADAPAVARAGASARQLPRMSECSLGTTHRMMAITPPAEDKRQSVQEFEARFDRLHLMMATGRYDAAREGMGALLELAEATEHDATISRALLIAADMASRDGLMDQAEAQYEEAARRAALAGDGVQVARVWIGWSERLVGVAHDAKRALTAATAAEVSLASIGGDPVQGARLELARGNIASAEHRIADAEQHYRASIEGSERALGPRHPDTISARASLASLRLRHFKTDEDIAGMVEVTKLASEVYGPNHPFTATSLWVLGGALTGRDNAAARGYLEQSLAIRRQALPADHQELVHSLHALASVSWELGDAEHSLQLETEAFEMGRRVYPEGSPEQTYSMLQLATIEASADNLGVAERWLTQVLDTLEDHPRHPVRIAAHFQLAALLANRDRTRALEHAETALRLRREAMPVPGPDRILFVHSVALRQWEAGDTASARRTFQTARALRSPGHPSPADDAVLLDWARFEAENGRATAELIAEVERMHKRLGGNDPAGLADPVREWLGAQSDAEEKK